MQSSVSVLLLSRYQLEHLRNKIEPTKKSGVIGRADVHLPHELSIYVTNVDLLYFLYILC